MAAGLSVATLRGLGAILALGVTVALSRLLGPAGLGIFAYALTCLTLAQVPIIGGWVTLLVKASAESRVSGNWDEARGVAIRGAQISFVIVLVLSASLFTAAFFASDAFPSFLTPWVLCLLALVLLFDQLSSIRAAILRGLDKPTIAQIPEMVIRPSVLTLGILLLLTLDQAQVSVRHAFIALAAAAGAGTISGYILLRLKAPPALLYSRPRFSTRPWLAIAAPLAMSAGLINLNTQLNLLILGVLKAPTEVGLYRVAVQVSLLSGFAYTALNFLANQRFAHFRAAEDPYGAQSTATSMARIAAFCALGVPLVLLLGGNFLVPLVFGSGFRSALMPMLILTIGQCLNAFVGMPRSLLVMNGMEKRVMAITALAVVINCILCLALIPHFGSNGAAWASTLATGLWNLSLWLTARAMTGLDTSVLGLAPIPERFPSLRRG